MESWTPLRYDEAQRRLKNLAFCGSSSYSSQAAESTPRAVLVTTNKARFGSLQHSHTKTSEESGALGALLGMNEPYVEATKEKEGGVDGDGDGGGGKKRKLEAAVPVPAGSLQYNYDNTKLFKCDHCLYSSNYKNHFEKHVTSIHFPEKHRYYYCEVEGCIHRAKQGTDLKKHQKNIHNIGEVIIYKVSTDGMHTPHTLLWPRTYMSVRTKARTRAAKKGSAAKATPTVAPHRMNRVPAYVR